MEEIDQKLPHSDLAMKSPNIRSEAGENRACIPSESGENYEIVPDKVGAANFHGDSEGGITSSARKSMAERGGESSSTLSSFSSSLSWRTSGLSSLSSAIYGTSKDTLKVLQSKARHIVSQNKRRYQGDGFDLDLSYVTDSVIAMGFPAGDMSSGILGYVEGFYRNHMEDVIKFLETRHQGKYKVYNLCSERLYDAGLFQGKVACFPFEDHNCPPLKLITSFCESCSKWMEGGEGRVCVVHCKAGMGRTGVMIACLLLYLKLLETAPECVQFFNEKRTVDGKGLVLPSQKRYVHYFGRVLGELGGKQPEAKAFMLRGIRLHRCPYWIRPSVTVSSHSGVLFSTRKHPQTRDLALDDLWRQTPRKGVLVFSLPAQPGIASVQGDFKVTFHDRNGDFYCWLHTGLTEPRTTLSPSQLDGFDKRQLGSPGFQVEVVLVAKEASSASPSPAPVPSEATAEPSGSDPRAAAEGAGTSTASRAVFAAATTAFSAFQSLYESRGSTKGILGGSSGVKQGEQGEELRPVGGSQRQTEEIKGKKEGSPKDDFFSDSDEERDSSGGVQGAAPGEGEKGVGSTPGAPVAIPPDPGSVKLQDTGKEGLLGENPAPGKKGVLGGSLEPGKETVVGEKKEPDVLRFPFGGTLTPPALQEPPLPSATSDFKALAAASAADASVFTFGDEDDF